LYELLRAAIRVHVQVHVEVTIPSALGGLAA
jgi:hypothetical protein